MEHSYREAYLYLMDQLTYEIQRLQSIQKDVEEMLANITEDEWEEVYKDERKIKPVDYLQIIHD
mgnify:CR=1 FL=1